MKQGKRFFFKDRLENIVKPKHPLCQLAKTLPWETLEKEFAKYYRNFGRPAKPTRLMISLLLLKQIYHQGDETVMEAWVQNPYWQYFSGEATFQWEKPCDPSDTKLACKIAEQCVGIARQEEIKLRRSYARTIPKLLFAQRGRHHPRGMKRAAKATQQLKTIAGRLVREFNRKLSATLIEEYGERLELFQIVLDQKRGDGNKIYPEC